MRVRLIAKTEPVIDVPADGLIPYVARVSNPDNQMNFETGPKLLRYLQAHQHWSPFEMVSATMEIETTRDIARQILRHRSFSFQEFSQRYSADFAMADAREARRQDLKNRQNSLQMEYDPDWESAQRSVASLAKSVYDAAIARGIAKEVARAVLPEGLTVSKLYMAGTLRSWLHYIELRTGPETQKEHREVAEAARQELSKYFPEAFQRPY